MEKQSFKVHHAAGEKTFYRYNVFSLLLSRFVSSKETIPFWEKNDLKVFLFLASQRGQFSLTFNKSKK